MNAQNRSQLYHLQFNRLANDFLVQGAAAPKRVVLFTASGHGEGTSTVAREFSKTLALQSGRKVILVDDAKIARVPRNNLERILVDKLRKDYDYIVVDTSSVLHAPEIVHWFRLADALYFVVAAERSRRPVVEKALETIYKHQVPVLGIILNRRRYPIPQQIYRFLYR